MQLGSLNLTLQMFHDESWKPIYFGVKVKVTTSVSVFRRSAVLLLLMRTYAKLGFPSVIPHAQASPCQLAAGCWIFPGMGFCTSVSAASGYSCTSKELTIMPQHANPIIQHNFSNKFY